MPGCCASGSYVAVFLAARVQYTTRVPTVCPCAVSFLQREDYDHVLVSEPVWNKLVAWYGGGPAIPRRVIVSEQTFQARIEMYPQYCKVRSVGDDGNPQDDEQVIMLGRSLTVAQALTEACAKLNVAPATSRMWAKVEGQDDFGLADPALTMGDVRRAVCMVMWFCAPPTDVRVGVAMHQIAAEDDQTAVLIETQNADGTWKRTVADTTAADDAPGADDPQEGAEPFDAVAWRAGLKVDDRLDAQDSDGKWFESIVREVKTEGGEDLLFIHYRGWEERWNSWTKRSSAKLQPRFTKVKNFRDFRVNDKIECKHARRWFEASVEDVRAARQAAGWCVAEARPC